MVWGAVIAGGAALLGGAMSNKSNARQADVDRAFQRENAMNAHQWQTADMRTAGLNPILSATGGSGARASGGSSLGTQTDEITPAVQSAQAARRLSQEMKVMKETENQAKTQAELNEEAKRTQMMNQAALASQSDRDRAQAAVNNEIQQFVKEQTKRESAQARIAELSVPAAKVQAWVNSQPDIKKLEYLNRYIQAGQGATSAIRNLLPSIPKFGK